MKPFINVVGDWNVGFHISEPIVVQLSAFALGYREAARALMGRLTTNAHGDYDGYPILYLYRHSLELYLKALVYRGASLLGLLSGRELNTANLFQRHELTALLAPTKAILSALQWDLNAAGFESFTEFETFIGLLDHLDPGSYAFRYPVNRAGMPPETRPATINVVAFAEAFDPLLDYLEGAVDSIQDHWQSAAEADYELHRYFEHDA